MDVREKMVTGMAKYIDREALVEWLKRIPLKDLSDGRGLCRVIFEDDFKRAIKKIPKGIIADVAQVRCRECKYSYEDLGGLCCTYGPPVDCIVPGDYGCVYGERRASDGE